MNIHEVTVIDYGVGNILSVQRGLEHFGAKVILTADPKLILTAKRIVLPGVGAFDNAMKSLKRLNLISVIHEVAKQKIPLLGICLGMQLLLDESEEFVITAGLGLIPGRVISVPNYTVSGVKQKIPHIGWNIIQPSNIELGWQNTLLENNVKKEAMYFVHSFMAVPFDQKHRIADCLYGGHKITAMIAKDNIIGCQFHPEKSGEAGLKILRKFILQ